MQNEDTTIPKLMEAIDSGKIQLPEFQRKWVWDDDRIKALIASIVNEYPIGAVMFLKYGNDSPTRFKYRPIEGAPADRSDPSFLVLDGQQRLTSIYAALFSDKPAETKKNENKIELRYYYIDIDKALDPSSDFSESIISVPKNKIITSNIGRNIELDLSTKDKEFEQKKFPLNIILNTRKEREWSNGYHKFYEHDKSARDQFFDFCEKVVEGVRAYHIPVISLKKETPREAVCQVFEHVNTGGVSLTVFELVTATFAMDEFNLQEDWEKISEEFSERDILKAVSSTDFLTASTLLAAYKKREAALTSDQKRVPISCKKKDVLSLSLTDYKEYKDNLTEGFIEAEKLLEEECVFWRKDLPYTTQLIPLAVLCTLLKSDRQIKTTNTRNKLKQWYWCGVFGELYGGATETRYVNDVVDVMDWIKKPENTPKTIQESFFHPSRLLTLQTRQSAAYKGIMALILKNSCRDFISGWEMRRENYRLENIDIHHVFPQSYCKKNHLDEKIWNSIVNKTPISSDTNKAIGGDAPSIYLGRIEGKKEAEPEKINEYLSSHWLDVEACRNDDFDAFIRKRATKLLNAIEDVTKKPIADRDSADTIGKFGGPLLRD